MNNTLSIITTIIRKKLLQNKSIFIYDTTKTLDGSINIKTNEIYNEDSTLVLLENKYSDNSVLNYIKSNVKNYIVINLDIVNNFTSYDEYVKYINTVTNTMNRLKDLNLTRLCISSCWDTKFNIDKPIFTSSEDSITIDGVFNGYINAKSDIKDDKNIIRDLRLYVKNSEIKDSDSYNYDLLSGNIVNMNLSNSSYILLNSMGKNIKVDVESNFLEVSGYKKKKKIIYKEKKFR